LTKLNYSQTIYTFLDHHILPSQTMRYLLCPSLLLIGCSDNNIRGGVEETAPAIHRGKHSKKFKRDNLCELQVFSNRAFGTTEVEEQHVDACLEHQDTTEIAPGAKGYALVTFGGGEARGNQMGVTFKCTTEKGSLIGELLVNHFDQVPKDSPMSSLGWFFDGVGKALKGGATEGEDTDPDFKVIVDAKSIPEAERSDIPPLHKKAAIKYCKQMRDIRDRVFPPAPPPPREDELAPERD